MKFSISQVKKPSFTIYDLTEYQNKPLDTGMRPAFILGQWAIYGSNPLNQMPPLDRLLFADSLIPQNFTGHININLEHLDVWNSPTNLQIYIDIYQFFKSRRPNCEMGYYSIVPSLGNYAPFYPKEHLYQKTWIEKNDKARPLAAIIDLSMPSLYLWWNNEMEKWKLYAKETISEARRCCPGKKVYPFIWPQYHNGSLPSNIGLQYMDEYTFYYMLVTLHEEADGVVIWKGFANLNEQWSEDMPWVKALRKFQERYLSSIPFIL